ncbi:hypothetical protein COMA2_20463 [Candidatus Nitrospira nitrificans]|uniref:Uncharacterized protein n=1 Tax=Candidatus Nitrospira nitrificans TaxID=1742973 RepID=A0A0S4LF44_9BACT|nr:hypothetical protein COMA2_20463 [Candidatus Nitrospira nitrificans]
MGIYAPNFLSLSNWHPSPGPAEAILRQVLPGKCHEAYDYVGHSGFCCFDHSIYRVQHVVGRFAYPASSVANHSVSDKGE